MSGGKVRIYELIGNSRTIGGVNVGLEPPNYPSGFFVGIMKEKGWFWRRIFVVNIGITYDYSNWGDSAKIEFVFIGGKLCAKFLTKSVDVIDIPQETDSGEEYDKICALKLTAQSIDCSTMEEIVLPMNKYLPTEEQMVFIDGIKGKIEEFQKVGVHFIHGKPGCGKSMVGKMAVVEMEKMGKKSVYLNWSPGFPSDVVKEGVKLAKMNEKDAIVIVVDEFEKFLTDVVQGKIEPSMKYWTNPIYSVSTLLRFLDDINDHFGFGNLGVFLLMTSNLNPSECIERMGKDVEPVFRKGRMEIHEFKTITTSLPKIVPVQTIDREDDHKMDFEEYDFSDIEISGNGFVV